MLRKWCFHLSISLRYAFCFKKILHRNIDFASNLIFWVGIGWGTGHANWIRRAKISPKTDQQHANVFHITDFQSEQCIHVRAFNH